MTPIRFPRIVRLAALLLSATAGAIAAAAPGAPQTPPAGAAALFDAAAILRARAAKDAFMRDHPQSPFKANPPVAFAPLNYFPPDPAWVFRSKLVPLATPEPVTIVDTKGRPRPGAVYGHLSFVKDGATHRVRVYRTAGLGGSEHYSIMFTDRTTGDTTYGVGRYLDFAKSDDPEHVYTLDFNLSYNPYCAYTPAYGCAVPRKEDRLDLAITAGEKKWHD